LGRAVSPAEIIPGPDSPNTPPDDADGNPREVPLVSVLGTQGLIHGAMTQPDVRLIIEKLGQRHNDVVERRASARIEVGLSVEAYVLRGQLFTPLGETWLDDLSEGGLGLLTERPVPKGSIVRIGFGSLFKDKFLYAQVTRSSRRLERAYGVGARIVHMSEDITPADEPRA
jgi:hypothetical protein